MDAQTSKTPGDGLAELALIKGEHRWVFRYPRGQELLALRSMAQAAGSNTGLDWADAAVLAKQLGYRFTGLSDNDSCEVLT